MHTLCKLSIEVIILNVQSKMKTYKLKYLFKIIKLNPTCDTYRVLNNLRIHMSIEVLDQIKILILLFHQALTVKK